MSESQCPGLHHLNKSEGETVFNKKKTARCPEKRFKTERVVVAEYSISQDWLTFKKGEKRMGKKIASIKVALPLLVG